MNTKKQTNEKIEIGKYPSEWLQWFRFLYQAIDKKSMRLAYHYIYIDNDIAVTSDSHQLHIVRLPKDQQRFSQGFYEVLSRAKGTMILLRVTDDKNLNFPKWQDILPVDYTKHFKVSTCGTKALFIGSVLSALGKNDVCVDYERLLPLMILDDYAEVWFDDWSRPIWFKFAHAEAVIMPLNAEFDKIEITIEKAITQKC